jgi:hypothetical protein
MNFGSTNTGTFGPNGKRRNNVKDDCATKLVRWENFQPICHAD